MLPVLLTMLKFILMRLAMMVPVLLGVMLVVFTLNYVAEGNPALAILGDAAPPEAIAQLRKEMGLDDPFVTQFIRFVASTARLDFGRSFVTNRPVADEIIARFPTTFQLAFMSVLLALFLGIPLGIISATKQYSLLDGAATFLGLLSVSIPNFWLGMMMIILFSVNLRMLPPSGFTTPMHWILPTLAVGTSVAAYIMRMTRSSMLEVVRQDYIRTARAKGQKESIVIYRHALKNALIPIVTVAGLQFGILLGGAVLTETIFAVPGLGFFMVTAIGQRDYPVIQGGVLLIAVAFSFVNLLVDILYAFIDPRIRSQYK